MDSKEKIRMVAHTSHPSTLTPNLKKSRTEHITTKFQKEIAVVLKLFWKFGTINMAPQYLCHETRLLRNRKREKTTTRTPWSQLHSCLSFTHPGKKDYRYTVKTKPDKRNFYKGYSVFKDIYRLGKEKKKDIDSHIRKNSLKIRKSLLKE